VYESCASRDSLTPRKIGAIVARRTAARATSLAAAANMVGDMAAPGDWSTAGHVRGVPSGVVFPSTRRRRRSRRAPAPTVVVTATAAHQYAQNGVPSVFVCVRAPPVGISYHMIAGNKKIVSSFAVRLVPSVVDRITVVIHRYDSSDRCARVQILVDNVFRLFLSR